MDRETISLNTSDFTATELVGEIKNASGSIDGEFIKAIEALMKKHQVNYVQLFWRRFEDKL